MPLAPSPHARANLTIMGVAGLNPDMTNWTRLKTHVHNSRYLATQVSQLTQVPWVRFSKAQQGKCILNPDEYERIAKVLDCHPMELVGYNDPATSQWETARQEADRAKRLRLERAAMQRLRHCNPYLYERIILQDPEVMLDGEVLQENSNGSRG